MFFRPPTQKKKAHTMKILKEEIIKKKILKEEASQEKVLRRTVFDSIYVMFSN